MNATRRYTKDPTSPEEFQERANEYFQACYDNGKRCTLTGLAYYTGFSCYNNMYLYRFDAFWGHTMQSAITFVSMGYEEKLHTGACAGAIFALKNIEGWSDRQTFVMDNQEKELDDTPSSAIENHAKRIASLKAMALTRQALPPAEEKSCVQ